MTQEQITAFLHGLRFGEEFLIVIENRPWLKQGACFQRIEGDNTVHLHGGAKLERKAVEGRNLHVWTNGGEVIQALELKDL